MIPDSPRVSLGLCWASCCPRACPWSTRPERCQDRPAQKLARRKVEGIRDRDQGGEGHVLDPAFDASQVNRTKSCLFGKSFLRQTQSRTRPPNVGGQVVLDLYDTGRAHLSHGLSRVVFPKQML